MPKRVYGHSSSSGQTQMWSEEQHTRLSEPCPASTPDQSRRQDRWPRRAHIHPCAYGFLRRYPVAFRSTTHSRHMAITRLPTSGAQGRRRCWSGSSSISSRRHAQLDGARGLTAGAFSLSPGGVSLAHRGRRSVASMLLDQVAGAL